jgi:integrase
MVQRKKLTDAGIRDLEPRPGAKYEEWDEFPGLCVRVESSGRKTFYLVYSIKRRSRWYKIGLAAMGDVTVMAVKDARVRARELSGDVARTRDPQAEHMAKRGGDTFAELYERYLDEHAKRHNKSWQRTHDLVVKHVLPKWAKLSASEIARADVRRLLGAVGAPQVANRVMHAVSAVFTWAMGQDLIAVNPCRGVRGNPTNSRDRILSDSEVPIFWRAADEHGPVRGMVLKLMLLTGQRGGELSHMRREHVRDGWWEMPGPPVPELKWPGTKNGNSHRVWLPAAARKLLAEFLDGDDDNAGFVFGAAVTKLDVAMSEISKQLDQPAVVPHDLRRTHGSEVTGRGHGREAMNRIQNHREGGIADVYDRHDYAEKDKLIMEDVAAAFMALIEGRQADNVIAGSFRK